MRFYRQVFDNLEHNILPKNRSRELDNHVRQQFPILYQQYALQITQFIDGYIPYTELITQFVEYRSRRILQIEQGLTRSRSYIRGEGDPVLSEIRRFQEAFGPRQSLSGDRVPGTGRINHSTRERVKTFLW